jgi:hypothetical protein
LVKNTKKTGTRILHYLCAIINFKFYSTMNRKMVLGGLLAIIIAAGAAWNVSLNSNVTDGNSNVTLARVEALSGEDINCNVPDKSNDPKTCTLEIYYEAGAEISPGNYAAKAGYHKVAGIKNTCRSGSSGCDPYNCHRRVY